MSGVPVSEPSVNPYAPPKAAVADAGPADSSAASVRLPVVLLMRWLLAAMLIVLGLWRTLVLVSNWRFFTDSMIIDPLYNPWPFLVQELCVAATGGLLGRRSRWVFVPLLLHVALFARQTFADRSGAAITGLTYEVWAAQLLVFGFCAWLGLRRGLK